MIGSLGQFTLRNLALGALGIALVASAGFGGWTLWAERELPTVNAAQPIPVAVSPVTIDEPLKTPPIAEKEIEPAVKPTPEVVSKEPQARQDIVRKRVAPKGKSHERQATLLFHMVLQLHNEAFAHFVDQPGFGMGRMWPTITVMPREWKMPEWTSEETPREKSPLKGMKDLNLIHRQNMTNFADPNTKLLTAIGHGHPDEKKTYARTWEIKSLDLVGLVMHETAVVYVSEKLPQMKDLTKTPTRDLDLFESEGLEELVNGKYIYIRAKGDTIRVLGPVQAGKACLKCHHDSKEGDLLGAFSYTLREGQYRWNGRSPQYNKGVSPNSKGSLTPIP